MKPSAFPVVGFVADASGALAGQVVNDPGMTLRDYFAGQALLAVCSSNPLDYTKGGTLNKRDTEGAVSDAYKIADMMMVQRKEGQ